MQSINAAREKDARLRRLLCPVRWLSVPWVGWAILSLIISPSPVNSHLDLPIVRSHLRMVVVAAERRRGLGMRSLETVLARAGKTKDQFYAHCDQIAAPYRAW